LFYFVALSCYCISEFRETAPRIGDFLGRDYESRVLKEANRERGLSDTPFEIGKTQSDKDGTDHKTSAFLLQVEE